MDSKQSRELTQKQKDLVKRLEKIRSNREKTEQSETKQVTRRNEKAQQQRPTTQKRTRTASERKFARPIPDAPTKVEPNPVYKAEPVQRQRRAPVTRKKTIQKRQQTKTENYIKQLSGGGKLSQAIILSEILDKPLALRKKK